MNEIGNCFIFAQDSQDKLFSCTHSAIFDSTVGKEVKYKRRRTRRRRKKRKRRRRRKKRRRRRKRKKRKKRKDVLTRASAQQELYRDPRIFR